MSRTDEKKLVRLQLGGLPLLHSIVKRIGLREILQNYVPTHGNETVSTIDTLILLVYNLVLGKDPLYKLEEWINRIDLRSVHLDCYNPNQFSDDRFGRALDKLYQADRASIMTELVLRVVEKFAIQTDRIHNDSTTVKAFGEIPGKTKSGFTLHHGHSKDHRPDLKQLLFNLSITADGAVPIHYKAYPGNRTDDTTHIETWKSLCKLCGKKDFIYVADSKVCTDEQLETIVRAGGRIITIMPETWGEVRQFKDRLRKNFKNKTEILRKKKNDLTNDYEYFSCFDGEYKTEKRGYSIHWIFSSEKKKRDQRSREIRLKKAEKALMELNSKINKCHLKKQDEIESAAQSILKEHQVLSFITIHIAQTEEREKKQVGKGRPGGQTKYKIKSRLFYTLTWYRDKSALEQERRVDGIFPLLSTDDSLSAKEVLRAYKYQPRLEKRFSQFKSIHKAAPLFFKSIERVESNMFVFFISLIVQSLLEREIRNSMQLNGISSLKIYPEGRESKLPTTNCVLDALEGISRYQIVSNDKLQEEYMDDLSKSQMEVLSLIKMKQKEFWNN